jgi:hypothetical protein
LSKAVTLSKLEALLARIRTRAAEPRSPRQPALAAPAPAFTPPAAPAPVAASPRVAVVRAPAPPPAAVAPPAFVAPPPAAVAPPEPARPRVVREPSPQPPEVIEATTLPPPPLVEVSSDADFEVEVEMPLPTPEPAVVSEAIDGKDSGERLSAAPLVAAEPAAVDVGPAIERVEVLSDEEGVADEDVDAEASPSDEVDETPASSRRPVTAPPEERLAELAFGSEEPESARHTPPPKSGRLPAPPAGEFDPDVTGVRATPGLSVDEESALLSPPPPEPSVLSAQAVRADLASGANVRVPDVIGQAQAFAPATFLALLDASLSL